MLMRGGEIGRVNEGWGDWGASIMGREREGVNEGRGECHCYLGTCDCG